jgi:hypothetical protein
MAALAVSTVEGAEAKELLSSEDGQRYAGLQSLLSEAGFASVDAYLESGEEDEAIDALLDEIGEIDEELYERVAEAAEQSADGVSAQEAILAFWNKNPDTAPGIDPVVEQPLLDALLARFEGQEDAIRAAMEEAAARQTETEAPEEGTEVVADCVDLSTCEAVEELAAN